MAYTYEQFESAASKAGLLGKFDRQDLVLAQQNPEYGISMLQLMKNRTETKTLEQRLLADEAVRQLRQTYGGYSSGGRLPEYADEVVQQADNYYAGQNAYRRALAEAEGYGSTAYDKKVGDIYARQSAFERQRAQADALATASAGTGGAPSSYAIRAAQDAAGEQDAQLDETILDLRRNAYQQALSAVSEKQSGTQTLSNTDDSVKKPEDTTKPAPDAGMPLQTLKQSIDGNIAIYKNMGWTDAQIRSYILGVLNNDGRTIDLTDQDFVDLLNYYTAYKLV